MESHTLPRNATVSTMPDRLDPVFVMQQIEALRYSHPGIWDEGDETLLLALESETDLPEFLARVIDCMDDAEENIDGIEIKMNERQARKARFEQRYKAMRELARKLMEQAGLRKVVLPHATLSISAGQPRVIVTDETALPPDCIRTHTTPNLIEIKKHLARGEPVSGAELSNAEPFLRVSSK